MCTTTTHCWCTTQTPFSRTNMHFPVRTICGEHNFNLTRLVVVIVFLHVLYTTFTGGFFCVWYTTTTNTVYCACSHVHRGYNPHHTHSYCVSIIWKLYRKNCCRTLRIYKRYGAQTYHPLYTHHHIRKKK